MALRACSGLARFAAVRASVVENLHNEAHLVGGAPFGDPKALAAFLSEIVFKIGGARRPARAPLEGHLEACKSHSRKGMPIPAAHLPTELRRYVNSKTTLGSIVEQFMGATARGDLTADRLSPSDALAEIGAKWSAPDGRRAAAALMFSEKDVVWATFTGAGATAPAPTTQGLTDALALPKGSLNGIFEMRYPRDHVQNHRFPTVADAGAFHIFRPAPEVSPDVTKPETTCGWTHPFVAGAPPQPELVHDNAALTVLTIAPRYVGGLA